MELNTDLSETLPFVCGICKDGYGKFQDFYQHLRYHDETLTKDVHLCSSHNRKTDTEIFCRGCGKKFTCLCNLHDHVAQVSAEGQRSYFFYSDRSIVYPVMNDCFKHGETDCKHERHIGSKFHSKLTSLFCDINDLLRSDEINYSENDSQLDQQEEIVPQIKSGHCRTRSARSKSQKDLKTPVIKKLKRIKQASEGRHLSSKRLLRTIKKVKQCQRKVAASKKSNTGAESKLIAEQGVCTLTEVSEFKEEADVSDTIDDSPLSLVRSRKKMQTEAISKSVNRKENSSKSCTSENEEMKQVVNKTSARLRGKPGRKQFGLETCDACGKKVKRSKMKIHIISHSSDRPFKCDKCPKTYKYREHLSLHMKSHDQVLPYYCEVCGQGFVDCNRLKRHVLTHTDKRPFECEVCMAGFVTRYKLQRHMQVHTGVKKMQCDLCGVQFANKETLGQHISLVHKKERRFNCRECDRSFFTNYQLRCHTMKHEGVRPFKCTHCKSDFIERKELRRHMKKLHSLDLNGEPTINTQDNVVTNEEPATSKPPVVDLGGSQEIVLNGKPEISKPSRHSTVVDPMAQDTVDPQKSVSDCQPMIAYRNVFNKPQSVDGQGSLLLHHLQDSNRHKLPTPELASSLTVKCASRQENAHNAVNEISTGHTAIHSKPVLSSMLMSQSGNNFQPFLHSETSHQSALQRGPAVLMSDGHSHFTRDVTLLSHTSSEKTPSYMQVKDQLASSQDRMFGPLGPGKDMVFENMSLTQDQPHFVMLNPLQQGDFTVL